MKTRKLDYKLAKTPPLNPKPLRRFPWKYKNIVLVLSSLLVLCVSLYYIFTSVSESFNSQNPLLYAQSQKHFLLVHEYNQGNAASVLHSVALFSLQNSHCVLSFYPGYVSLNKHRSLQQVYAQNAAQGILEEFAALGAGNLFYLVVNAQVYMDFADRSRKVLLYYQENADLDFPVNVKNSSAYEKLFFLKSAQMRDYLSLGNAPKSSALADLSVRYFSVLLQGLDYVLHAENPERFVTSLHLQSNASQNTLGEWLAEIARIDKLNYYIYPYTYRKVDGLLYTEPSFEKYIRFLELMAYYYKTYAAFTAADYLDILVKQGLTLFEQRPVVNILDCRKEPQKPDALNALLQEFEIQVHHIEKNQSNCTKRVPKSYIVNTAKDLILLRYIQNILRIPLSYETFNVRSRKKDFLVVIGEDFHELTIQKAQKSK